MKQQKEWFTGIDYYDNSKEKEIYVDEYKIDQPISLHAHVQVELWYVLSGSACMQINGNDYHLESDSFLCLYSHHLYQVYDIEKPLHVIVIKFFIGLFMHMMWEKHSPGKNAEIVYETCPLVNGKNDNQIKKLFMNIDRESTNAEFGSKNMIMYQTLELHTLHCRYALNMTKEKEKNTIWTLIQNIIVSPSSDFSLKESAATLGYHPNYLNKKIKKLTGMSFLELCQFAKILNACALLHFEELDMSYIVEQMGCTSTATFYRIFEKFTGMTPLQYQKEKILDFTNFYYSQEDFLKIIQYIFLNFSSPIHIQTCSTYLHMKKNEVEQILKQYNYTFFQLVEEVRYLYSRVLLRATTMPITQIALDCGFGSLTTFLRVFTKLENCTPSEYRRKTKNVQK